MSPVPRSGRNLVILLGIALALSISFAAPAAAQENATGGDNTTAADGNATAGDANETGTDGGADEGGATGAGSDLGVPADAPQPEDGRITRVLTFGVIEENCPGGAPAPCFDVATLVANPGDVVVLHGNFLNSAGVHNIHATEGVENGPKTDLQPEALHTISFVMGEDPVRVVCDAHATTMILDVVDPATALSSGAHGQSVPALGVHFLAYWVGVIAFAILFIVYGLTFFLFKYNETTATTDHWDRSENPGESKRLAAIAPLLAVVIAIAAIAAIIFVATR